MKLARFIADGIAEIGVLTDRDHLASLSREAPGLVDSMPDLLEHWEEYRATVEACIWNRTSSFKISDVHLLPPIAEPEKMVTPATNFVPLEKQTKVHRKPVIDWHPKAMSAVSGPYDPIKISMNGPAVDYEAELIAVIGTPGKNIAAADAHRHVVGYCVGNDVTERVWQMRTMNSAPAKAFDTFAPFGPWITTGDEIADPHQIAIKCFVNGEVRQSFRVGELVYSVWELIENLSRDMTLKAGDLVMCGTGSGIGAERIPAVFLQPGDIVRCESEKLGHIENKCELENPQAYEELRSQPG
jgi:2-keto-4-pentenoate hydratase/2-oxohepta-3-ene-1,7-dioic acid hydratase in catechol pathway